MNVEVPLASLGFTPPQFSVGATESLQEKRPRTLKQGDTFAVFDHNGDVISGDGRVEGLYHLDTRHLSHFDVLLAGQRPMLLSSTLREDNASLTCDLTNPDYYEDGEAVLEHDLIHLRRSKFLWNSTAYERIAVRNFADRRQRLEIEIRFDADFADLFEVRGMRRERRGERHPPQLGPDGVTLSYTGLDNRRRFTRLRFDPMPARLEPYRAVFELDLPPQARAVLYVNAACDDAPAERRPGPDFFGAIRAARRALRRNAARAAAIETSNQVFNEAVRRSVADLYMLVTDTDCGPYPYAGIPWFSAAFGRDALVTGLQTLWLDPTLARGILSLLAEHQARDTDPAADAEPGKILHEVRHGEMAELAEVPFRHYYGSVDSTPLFVMLAGNYLDRTGDVETARRLWPNVEAALTWIDRYGDRDGDGFVEYHRMTENGLANQGWKDSHDSVFHANGSAAQGPIALVEVQAYVYAARLAAARIATRLGLADRATSLQAQAAALRERIEQDFWSEELGTYALALDGDKRRCDVRTSNAGHVLLAGVASPDRAARVARQMMDSSFFSGWGIRTLASGEVRYNPMSYHNGSVWPHDNSLVALGFGRYGLRQAAARIFDGLFDASTYLDLRRLPELFCGFPRRRAQGPTAYPVACAPQAWSAGSMLSLLQSCLGISFDPDNRTVLFNNPVLPRFMDEILIRNIHFDGAGVDVILRRTDGDVALNVLQRRGDIRVTMTS